MRKKDLENKDNKIKFKNMKKEEKEKLNIYLKLLKLIFKK